MFSTFDRDAKSIIDHCFLSDESFAVSLLREQVPFFGNLDPLKIAEEADCRCFLASKAVQKLLDHKWQVFMPNSKKKRLKLNFSLSTSGSDAFIIKVQLSIGKQVIFLIMIFLLV